MIQKRFFNINLIVLLLILFSVHTSAFAEFSTDIELFNTSAQILNSGTDKWSNSSRVGANVLLRPFAAFDDKFTFDAQFETQFFTNFSQNSDPSSNDFNISQGYIDFLIYDRLGFKIGKKIVDFGYQGYFQPVRLGNIINENKSLFESGSDSFLANNALGSLTASIDYRISGWDWPISLQLATHGILLDEEMFLGSRNYYIMELEGSGTFWNITALVGTGGESLKDMDGQNRYAYYNKRPIQGLLCSVILPYNILYFSEYLLKYESTSPFWLNNSPVDYRNDLFLNFSQHLEIKKDFYPAKLSFEVEYLFNGEGMAGSELKSFCVNEGSSLKPGYGLTLGKQLLTGLIGITYEPISLDMQLRGTMNLDSEIFRMQISGKWVYGSAEIGLTYDRWFQNEIFDYLIDQHTQALYLSISVKL